MKEQNLSAGKGMPVLLITLALYVLSIAGIIFAAVQEESGRSTPVTTAVLVVGIVWLCLGWILLCGLKVLKPQEALVLTLLANMWAPCGERASTSSTPSARR